VDEWPSWEVVLAYVANNDTNDILITKNSLAPDHWGEPVRAGGHRSKTAPAMRRFNGQLFIAFVSNDDRNLLVLISEPDGWSEPTLLGPATKFAPALYTWRGKLILAYVDSDAFELRTMSSRNGVFWTDPRPVPGQASFAGPALTHHGDKLVLVYVAANDRHDLLTATSSDGITWSDSRLVEAEFGAQQSNKTPAVVGDIDLLRMVYIDEGGALRPTISRDGVNWTNPGVIGATFGRTGFEGSDSSDIGVALSYRWWSDFYWPGFSTRAFPRDRSGKSNSSGVSPPSCRTRARWSC
jgi:hypothetical protein